MNNSVQKRLQREYDLICEDCKNVDDPEICVRLVDSNLQHMVGRIKGPRDTPYEGGYFFLDIHIPNNYPFEPPKIKFDTKIWHPNISSQTGAICLDILKDTWTPAYTIRTSLLSIELLLQTPTPDDPQDAEVASMYLKDYDQYCARVRAWVNEYARDTAWPYERKLVSLGFDESVAEKALVRNKYDLDMAINDCLNS